MFVLSSACFTGSDAAGLPCEKDDDCGLKQTCENGFCGGPPAGMETSSSGTIDPTTSNDGSSGPDPNCGNGTVEADEDCEPPGPGLNGPDCDRDCTMPLCGDGIENPLATDVEECDASMNSGAVDGPDCDVDCSAVVCGDAHANAFVEPCDDANADDYDGCTAQCYRTFLADPMTEVTADWTVETPSYVADLPRGGTLPYQLPAESSDTLPERSEPTGWRHPTARWESGPLPFIGFPDSFEGAPGTTRLVSRELELSLDLDGDGDTEDDAALLDGVRFELRFHHEYAFDGCGQAPGDGDGGVIRVHDVAADTYDIVAPVGGYPATIRGGTECLVGQVDPHAPNPIALDAPPTPYGEVAGYTGTTTVDEDVVVDLDEYRGKTIRIVFEMGFDCLSCELRKDDAWKVDHVIVAPYPR